MADMAAFEFFFGDEPAMARHAAESLIHAAGQAVTAHGYCALALSGGSSPASLFRLLREEPWRSRMPWPQTRVFFADERCVPPEHALSNYGMVREMLLAYVPAAGVFRMHGEDDPREAASRYAEVFRIHAPQGLHCAVLGMGADGHTASLFPHSAALDTAEFTAMTARPDAMRVTLTFPVLDAVPLVIFYVKGQDKAARVRELFAGNSPSRQEFPAAHVRAARRLWVLESSLNPEWMP